MLLREMAVLRCRWLHAAFCFQRRLRRLNETGCTPQYGVFGTGLVFFLIRVVGGGVKVHSTLRPLNGLLCQPRVIMIMEKSVE
jgi:hypothetical protein